ncbi:MAG: protein-disulfide reductase DsbD family protein [Moraxella sp.]|nr:protein-disulfide reductase DsbD family protein [Moraxella sp.]
MQQDKTTYTHLTKTRQALLAGVVFFGLAQSATAQSNTDQSGASIVTASPLATSGGLLTLFGSKPKFLPVTEAFSVMASQSGDTLSVRFGVTPAHYVYQDKLSLALPEGVTATPWRFDKKPTTIDDPTFGKVAVFEEDVIATTRLIKSGDSTVDASATVTWQGCAKAGLCYPPEKLPVSLSLGKLTPAMNLTAGTASPSGADTSKLPHSEVGNVKAGVVAPIVPTLVTEKDSDQPIADPSKTATSEPVTDLVMGATTESAATHTADETSLAATLDGSNDTAPQMQDGASMDAFVQQGEVAEATHGHLDHSLKVAKPDSFGLTSRPVLAVFLLFLAGIALAFTACVYPMIPIVANIVAKSHNPTPRKAFMLTTAYGLGVATSYGIFGALVAWLGARAGFIGMLQNPWILLGFAVFFVGLGLQMMGYLKVGLPVFLKERLGRASRAADHRLGSVGGSMLAGALSALVLSPCVSAPMAGALLAVSVTGNVGLGFFALFALGLGLSLPLVVMGTAQGRFMPKTGAWLERTQFFGGLMLMLVAIMLVGRVFFSPWVLGVWAVWCLSLAVFFWRTKWLFLRALAAALAVWSVCLIVGAAMGERDAKRPLHKLSVSQASSLKTHDDIRMTHLDELDALLLKEEKVLVELTAEWCVECRIMERTLFTERPEAMMDWRFVRLDITDTTPQSREILARYGLFGPPALLYYQAGKLSLVQLGEVSRADFEQALTVLN